VLPADQVEQLEGLVCEVERVPLIEEEVVRARGEDHLRDLLLAQPDADRRPQAALRRLGRARLDEAAKPGPVHLGPRLPRGQRLQVEVRRLAGRVARDVHEPVVERAGAVRRLEHRQDAPHRREDRHPRAPAVRAVARAEECRPLEDRSGLARLAEPDDGFREHEPDVLLQPLVQLAQPVPLPVRLDRPRVQVHLAVAHLDMERRHVVCKRVEGAPAGEVEARVVPVAGEDAVAHRAAAEREAHVRAAVVQREDLLLVHEEYDRPAAGRHDPRLPPLQLLERPDVDGAALGPRFDALLLSRGHRSLPSPW
jgi:hypothetical protein